MALRWTKDVPTQVFDLGPNQWSELAEQTGPPASVVVHVRATDAVNVYFVDDLNFRRLIVGQQFQWVGQERTLQFHRQFNVLHSSLWHVVVFNPTGHIARVHLSALVQFFATG